MDSQISVRIQGRLDRELNRAELENRSEKIRQELVRQLWNEASGVCAKAGKICYEGECMCVDVDSPIGEFYDIPPKCEQICLVEEEFQEAKNLLAHSSNGDKPIEIPYLNKLGVATYAALAKFFNHPELATSQSSGLAYKMLTGEDVSESLRLSYLLIWSHQADFKSDLISPETIWQEHDDTVKEGVLRHLNTEHYGRSEVLDIESAGVLRTVLIGLGWEQSKLECGFDSQACYC